MERRTVAVNNGCRDQTSRAKYVWFRQQELSWQHIINIGTSSKEDFINTLACPVAVFCKQRQLAATLNHEVQASGTTNFIQQEPVVLGELLNWKQLGYVSTYIEIVYKCKELVCFINTIPIAREGKVQ